MERVFAYVLKTHRGSQRSMHLNGIMHFYIEYTCFFLSVQSEFRQAQFRIELCEQNPKRFFEASL